MEVSCGGQDFECKAIIHRDDEMVDTNWKSYAPKVTQLRPGVFIFDFEKEEHKIDVIQRNWSFNHKFSMVLKFWDVDQEVDKMTMNTTPVWVQLPGLNARLWSTRNLS